MYRVGDAGEYLANPPELKKVHDPSRANFFQKKFIDNFFWRVGYLSTWNLEDAVCPPPSSGPPIATHTMASASVGLYERGGDATTKAGISASSVQHYPSFA
jgi:hypothetical protein